MYGVILNFCLTLLTRYNKETNKFNMKNKTLVVILVTMAVLLCCCAGGAVTGMAYYYFNVEQKITPSPINNVPDEEACVIGGCSGQLCHSESEQIDGITTCEWNEEFACLIDAKCERQADGSCGWTFTEDYYKCILDLY